MANDANPKFEIPNEMRDFAEKSVEQARKAFDSFMDAAQKASTTLETQQEEVGERARIANASAVAYAEANIAATFAYAQKLVRAKDLHEMVAIQTEFAKSQVETLTKQMNEKGQSSSRRSETK